MDGRDADDLADLVKALNDVGITGEKLENYVPAILDKLNNISGGDDLGDLVRALNDANPKVELTQEHIDIILWKFKLYDGPIIRKIELAIMLKRNNSGVELPDCLIAFWNESLLESEFFKNQKSNKKEENLNNDLTVKSKENDEISTSNKKVVQNSHNNSNQEKSILALAVIKHLENRLENLQLHNLDAEKAVWEHVADNLAEKEIITEKHKNEFYNKLNSVCDVSVVVSAILWIGCVLLVPITLLFALKSDEIEDRISHPTNRRVFERLKECKNDLFSPLKTV